MKLSDNSIGIKRSKFIRKVLIALDGKGLPYNVAVYLRPKALQASRHCSKETKTV